MEPGEQAKVRLQMALKAAAAADEQLRKMQEKNTMVKEQRQLTEQPDFAIKVEDIESSAFTQSTFVSGTNRVPQETPEEEQFGTIAEIKPGSVKANTGQATVPDNYKYNIDIDTFAHPSLFIDISEKKKRWLQKLTVFRKRKTSSLLL